MPLSITLEQVSSRKQQTLHVTKPKRTAKLFTVRLPKWFLHRQYEVQLLHTTSGWPFTLNACSIVPYDSPFFEACRTGDVDTIKILLSNQQASIYDRDPQGNTAFQYAIALQQLEVCKLLRHAGIFAQFDDDDHRRSLYCLERIFTDFTEHSVSLLRVAAPVDAPDQNWFEEYYGVTTDDGTVCVPDNIELISLLNSAQSPAARMTVSHLRFYYECRLRRPQIGYYNSFMPYIARVLSNTSTVRELTAARDKYAWIAYALASEIAHEYPSSCQELDNDHWLQNVRQAMCAVVRAGLIPHQTSVKSEPPWVENEWHRDLRMTPLGLLCFETTPNWWKYRYWTRRQCNRDPNLKLQAWLSGLHSAGIDLVQYAASESAYFGGAPESLAIPWENGGIITVVTGPRPEHWRLSLWQPCESYARLFWSFVEGTPVVPELAARIIEVFPLSASQEPTSPDLPGSWPSQEARIAKELENWLLGGSDDDDELAQIEEDLSLLSEADFLAKWRGIDDIVGLRR